METTPEPLLMVEQDVDDAMLEVMEVATAPPSTSSAPSTRAPTTSALLKTTTTVSRSSASTVTTTAPRPPPRPPDKAVLLESLRKQWQLGDVDLAEGWKELVGPSTKLKYYRQWITGKVTW